MYARPEIRTGVARLAAHGLVLDAWCYHPQLTDVIALAPEMAGPESAIKQQLMLGRIAQRLAIQEETVWARLKGLRDGVQARERKRAEAQSGGAVQRLNPDVLHALVIDLVR